VSDLEIWSAIVLLTLATFIARSGFWLAGARMRLPDALQGALRYAPACALAAIIFPDLILVQGQPELSWHNPRLLAGIVAAVFFQWRKNMLQTILFGMLVFTVLRLLMQAGVLPH
jgi:branched-subunit amino acid transport protein